MCLDNWSWRQYSLVKTKTWHLLVTFHTSMLQTLCILKPERILFIKVIGNYSFNTVNYQWMAEFGRDYWRSLDPSLLLSGRATCSQLSRAISRYIDNICKEGSSAKSPDKLCQWSLNLRVNDGPAPAKTNSTSLSHHLQQKKSAPF